MIDAEAGNRKPSAVGPSSGRGAPGGSLARRLAFAVVSVVLVVVLCLALLEVGLRVYCSLQPNADVEFYRYAKLMKASAADSRVSFRHAPGSRLELFGVDVSINSLGFRDVELVTPKPLGTTRLFLLGDSITFGWGVPYGERFSEILEREWSAASGRPFELVNTGHGNYNTAQECALLVEELSGEECDGLLQVWYINDAESTPPHRVAPWYTRFYTAIFLWAKKDLLKRRVGSRETYVDYYRDLYAEGAPGRPAFTAALTSTGAWAREREVPWVFVVLPEFHDFDPDGSFADVYAFVKRTAAEAGAIVVDSVPAFANLEPSALWVAPNDVHPNAAGHAVIARAILESVSPELFGGGASAAAGGES